MNWYHWALLAVALLFFIPAVVHMCMFMGATGFYKAKSQYVKDFLKGGVSHGEDERKNKEESPRE